MIDRYVVVDGQFKTIIGGPYLWDGVGEAPFPEHGTVLLEADALSQGYSYPPPEEPPPDLPVEG